MAHREEDISDLAVEPIDDRSSGAVSAGKHSGAGAFHNLVAIVALVLAALQLVPSFIPKSQWIITVAGIVGLGVCVYLYIQYRRAAISYRVRFLAVVIIALFLAIASGIHIYKLRGRIAVLEAERTQQTGSEPLQKYLAGVVNEGNEKWDGQFESRYARPTLYLLNDDGTRQPPLKMQEHLMLWRIGTAGLGPEFRAVAGLVGDISPDERTSMGLFGSSADALDPKAVATGIVNYVERPLADSDLLNKQLADPKQRGTDDIPARVLLLADPAAGKSTLLERLDLVQARRARGSAAEAVPVRISLAGMDRPTKDTILQRVRERLGDAADDVFAGRTMIILADSLDESGDPVAACRAITEFINEYQGASKNVVSRIIVTCRLRNYAQALHESDASLRRSGFSTVILYGLDQTAIEKQILTLSTPEVRRRLFLQLADSKSRSAWLQFLRLPQNYELVAELIAASESDVLPQGQTQLFEGFVNRRFSEKGIAGADAEHCKAMLSAVAVRVAKQGIAKRGSYNFDADDFRGPDDKALSEAALQPRIDQILRTGLVMERKRGKYRFIHQNVLDFFIASGLPDIELMDPKDADWREIILFRCGMSDGAKVLEMIQRRKAAGDAIEDGLVRDAERIVLAAPSQDDL